MPRRAAPAPAWAWRRRAFPESPASPKPIPPAWAAAHFRPRCPISRRAKCATAARSTAPSPAVHGAAGGWTCPCSAMRLCSTASPRSSSPSSTSSIHSAKSRSASATAIKALPYTKCPPRPRTSSTFARNTTRCPAGRPPRKAFARQSLPRTALDYLKFISDQLQVEIGMVSTGPERDATIVASGTQLASWL